MNTRGHARSSNKQIILSLLGVNRGSSQSDLKGTQKKIDILCLILVCLGAGYLATLQGFDSLPMNADTLAPFEEAKSLISNPNTHLFNIHVSRIASIFPDLTLNAFLQLILPKAGFLEIFSWYSWCTSTIFLALTTVLIKEITQGTQTLTATSIKTSLAVIALLNLSHQFNIVYAHILTPVHHGGNILNTLILLILALRLLKGPKRLGTSILFAILTCLAAMSNKLSIFTAAMPTGIIFLAYMQGHTRKKYLLILILSASTGLLLGSLLNEQCASPEFDLSKTLFALKQYFLLSWITTASAVVSIITIFYATSPKTNLPLQTKAGLTAISFSSLSYFIYLPMLTSSGEAPTRYICISYALLVVFLIYYINKFIRKENAIALITLTVFAVISFQSPVRPYLNITEHHSLKQELLNRSERIEPFKNDAADFIHKMGYNSYLGVGEYWMTSATLLSNSKIFIVPILKSGKPDFWGATPQDIREHIEKLKGDKTYLLSDNDKFKNQFETRYGTATTTWNYDNETRKFTQRELETSNRLLIYDNPDIYKTIRKKSKHFSRQCNRSLPNYKKR